MKKFILSLVVLFAPNFTLAEVIPFSIERTHVETIITKDREYDLFIKTPRFYLKDTEKKYPIIVLSDGSYSFPLVSSITRQMSGGGVIEEPIIVGVSYDKKTRWDISRTRDYTPTYSPNEEQSHSKEANLKSGGADNYLLIIENTILPFMRANYRVDRRKEIYAGHSYGGLFGGFILKTKPELFDFYILSDPSFWYHNGSIFGFQQEPSNHNPNVVIFSQARKSELESQNCGQCMAENAENFSNDLKKQLPKAKIEYFELENEIHETVFPISVSRGLRNFLGK